MTYGPTFLYPRGPFAAANDNLPNVGLMPPRCEWDVYWAARRGRFVGRVFATDADGAIRAAAVEFDRDVRKLIAIRRAAAWNVL